MRGRYPFELRYKYPHMGDEDKAIWERFIVANPGYFESVDYDVPVGSLPEFSTIVTPETGGDDKRLYQKKIDVVGYRGDIVFIIEIKPRADGRALGQALTYAQLYKRDIDSISELKPMVITDEVSKDIEEVAQNLEVKILKA